MSIAVVAALIAAIIGPLAGYIGAVRRLSGRIGTSEASDLWDESRSIRDDYRSQIEAMRKVIDNCQERIEKLEKRNHDLYIENGKLARMLEQHEETIAELRAQVHRLSDDNDRLRCENVELLGRVKELEATTG